MLVLAVFPDPGGIKAQYRPSSGIAPVEDVATNDNLHIALGSSDGIRLGAMYFPAKSLGLELAAGYVRLSNEETTETGSELGTSALAFTVGGDYLTHPDNIITGDASLLVTYIHALKMENGIDQSRWAVSLSFGALYHVSPVFLLFFRAGPSVHFLSRSESGAVQTFLNFDGGFGITL